MVKKFMVQKQCEVCNYSFETNRINAKYCSHKCYHKKRAENDTICICDNCKNEFVVSKYRYDLGLVKYCSIGCRNTSNNWIESNRIKNLNQLHKIGPNKLELAGREILEELKIKFLEQVILLGKFTVDVYIPEKKIVIQWDGNYWHGHPDLLKNGKPNKIQKYNLKKDIRVTSELQKNGYKVIRFWEKDVYSNSNLIKKTIQENMG